MRVNTNMKCLVLFAAMLLTAMIYWPGLSGNYLFDDYPNILDNPGVQPHDASVASLVAAALSSPSSEFSRPLSSLSFAANFLATGLNPYWMKLTNLVIHLLNGLLVFFLAGELLKSSAETNSSRTGFVIKPKIAPTLARNGIIAALIAASWMLLPINLTAVLYVVQRMESLANLFVLLGLIGYVTGRRRMLATGHLSPATSSVSARRGFWLCAASITLPTVLGMLAKETAVMLPFYAMLIEWLLYGFRMIAPVRTEFAGARVSKTMRVLDRRLAGLFFVVLGIPFIVGTIWMIPGLLQPGHWGTRNFTLGTRLLSEARIVVDYIVWTLLPTPHDLSFYHDNFRVSTGLLAPWTTLASLMALTGLLLLAWWLRQRRPLVALGIAMFLGCQLLTGTVLPLELIYEHRNYFASFGLMLAIVPLLAAPSSHQLPLELRIQRDAPLELEGTRATSIADNLESGVDSAAPTLSRAMPFALPRYVLLCGLMLCWAVLTAITAYAWGNPLRLAEDLASRAPQSPRAQYELGRTYIVYSHYEPSSPFTQLAYAPLERAAALPNSSVLPEQALIFMNSRMHLPLKNAWWDSLIGKLKSRPATVQDESSLAALTQCANEHHCDLPQDHMMEAFLAALAHPDPSARLMANYGDYAWNQLNDKPLGLRMLELAVHASPGEPVYRITLIRMLVVENQLNEAHEALQQLQGMNYAGRLNAQMTELRMLPGM